MASPGEGGEGCEGNDKPVDPTPGTLVWVRRRNGSWWPGRIMGLDEFPETYVHSSRSGTPIKLLGKDDASVDWYNLERSKRVKPFRCGEYDECIEKAMAAAAANPNKKAAKYARREDAIIHALELENAYKIKDGDRDEDESENESELFSITDNSSSEEDGSSFRDDPTISDSALDIDDTDDEDDSEEISTPAHGFSHSGLSFEDPKHITGPKVESVDARRRKNPNDSDDDGTEGIKRMRGLEDLGVGRLFERDVHPTEIIGEFKQDCVQNDRHISSLKRKRPQVHEFLKKKSRHRPLSKVLECTEELVSVPVTYEELITAGASTLHEGPNKIAVLESDDTAKNLSGVINNSTDSTGASFEHESGFSNSQNKFKERGISNTVGWPEDNCPDSLFDVPYFEDKRINSTGFSDILKSSDGEPKVDSPTKQSGQGSQSEAILSPNEEFHESGLTNSEAAYDTFTQILERVTSNKWQSKGKRKARYSTDKSIKREIVNFVAPEKISFDSSPIHRRSLPYRQSRFSVNPKYQNDDYPARNDDYESCLYEVDIEVKANYKPQHVPLVSLMSKLNGKAIVGHPLTVEVIDEGSSDKFIKMSVELGNTEKSKKVASPGAGRYSHGKPPKAGRGRGGSSLKRTRTLSSLTRCQKPTAENIQHVVEKTKAPAIKCIPLNVVFSRLNEALK